MSASYDLFEALKNFDNFRREQRSEYLSTMESLAKYKNSEGYKRDKEKATEKRKKATDLARETATQKINECLQQMRKNTGKIALVAPTQEMTNILSVLSLKSKISRQELERAATTMNGNSLALSALNDLADRQEGQSHPNYLVYSSDLSGEAIERYINSLAKYCRDILRSGAKKSALEGAVFNQRMKGIPIDEDSLPQREPLVSEREFYLNVVSENNFDSFMKAVNG